jgi:hypothetical protein
MCSANVGVVFIFGVLKREEVVFVGVFCLGGEGEKLKVMLSVGGGSGVTGYYL